MNMRSLNDNSAENAVKPAGMYNARISSTIPREPQIVDRDTLEVNDRNVPPIFGQLWRECASVFTLAVAPGLNVPFNSRDSANCSSCLLEA